MRILDLFSGIGGFTLGFHAANYETYDFSKFPHKQECESDGFYETVGFCEIEPYCQKLLNLRYPQIPLFEDVTKITADDLAKLGKIDIITGGFPCQDLSSAGLKRGLGENSGDTRSSLFREILRIAEICKPKYLVFENVKELITNETYFKTFIVELNRYGYTATPFLLSAGAFNYPHERKRAFVIAYPNKEYKPICNQLLPSITPYQGDSKRVADGLLHAFFRNASELKLGTIPHQSLFDKQYREMDGLPTTLDRLGALGNSVVPEIVCYLARIIKDLENANS